MPTVGLTAMFIGESSVGGSMISPESMALLRLSPIAHRPTPNSDTSTTDGSPVRSRANNAPAIPPAIVMPPSESP